MSTTTNLTSSLPSGARDAQASLMRLATGYRLSQMLRIAAKLGIADLLADGPKTCDEIAHLSGTHTTSM